MSLKTDAIMKMLTVIGARPQFIKAAAVSRVLQTYPDVEEVILHTGQHYDADMSDIFFTEMGLPQPKYNIHVNGLNHGAMTGQMMEKIEEVLLVEKPDWVLVFGDTNSTLAGALAAKKLHIKVAHVEAGLRSFNMAMPEEINRLLTDRISDILFCPTATAMANLEKEGYESFPIERINIGDVMLDAALMFEPQAKQPAGEIPDNFILATVHRAQTTDNAKHLSEMFEALDTIAAEQPMVMPLHPRTHRKLEEQSYNFANSPIHFLPPVGYLEMLWLLSHCSLVMTDSGGLQKEAYFFRKMCITLREETEWVELVDAGCNVLAGTELSDIIATYHKVKSLRTQPSFDQHFYGHGHAAKTIASMLWQNA